jgi:hypothetical protein
LWGALATVLRFIPYIGPWIAAGFPIILSLAVSPSWMAPALTLGLFIALEIFSNNVMEPWLYGTSTGVTPVALIVAVLVWTWLWGPVGLVLATPLTVCLVVMGRHIPRLAFLSIMLSDEEPLTPAQECYYRLHRMGENDEMELVDQFLKSNAPVALFDSMLVPVLIAAGTDHRHGELESEQLDSIERGIGDILDDLALRPEFTPSNIPFDSKICAVSAKTRCDELATAMLVQLLRMENHAARSASAKMLSAELTAWVHQTGAKLVIISLVAPTAFSQARYLAGRLRAGCPEVKIIVGLWGKQEVTPEALKTIMDSGADEIVTTMEEALKRVRVSAAISLPREPALTTSHESVA